MSEIGTLKIKARFEIFDFYFSQNFNFSCILGVKGTRSLWNDGQQIFWDHIIYLVNDEVNFGLKLIPKLTLKHIHFSSYSVINVSFAVQVLNSTVANVLRNYYGEETHGTAKLCEYLEKFFDCLNARNQVEGIKKRKSFLHPHTDLNDEHFK